MMRKCGYALRQGLLLSVTAFGLFADASAEAAPRWMEALDRGAVAVPAKGGGNLVSWRLLAPDAPTTEFDVYRDGRKINARSLSGGTNIVDKAGTPQSTYVIRTRVRGKDIEISKPVGAWAEGYLSIPIPPYPSFYLGDGTKIPRVPNIVARKSSKGGAK